MDVLLKSDVEKLGARGEVVKVSVGYARNYLLPKGLAVKVDKANAYQLEMERRRLVREQARQAAERQAFAERLRSLSLTITATATEAGHLYGSVGPEEIVAALSREGVSLSPVAIQLEKPIKELGVYEVPVQVAEDLASTVRVWVVGG